VGIDEYPHPLSIGIVGLDHVGAAVELRTGDGAESAIGEAPDDGARRHRHVAIIEELRSGRSRFDSQQSNCSG
jgi:hypothetical protein